MRGNPNIHIKRRETIQTAIEKLICIIFGECLMAMLYNSHGILQVSHIFFSILDYFLVSNSLVNTVCDCTIIPGFKSDH